MYTAYHIVQKLDNPDRPDIEQTARRIDKCMSEFGLPKLNVDSQRCDGDVPIFIALGGDGTMVQAMTMAHEWHGVAIGFNHGNVGFLTEAQSDTAASQRLMHDIIIPSSQGLFVNHIDRMVLQCSAPSHVAGCVVAINEWSLTNAEGDSLISYRLTIDGVNAGEHKANSLILATATGSTAYALSAGGALMVPNTHSYQLVPVAPLSMSSRPIIVSRRSRVQVSVSARGTIMLKRDGQLTSMYSGDSNPSFTFQPHHRDVTTVHCREWDFFSILKTRMGWR